MLAYAKPEQKQDVKSAVQKKEPEDAAASPNLTGIPDTMKTRFENLSGFSFDDVRVHYNSDKPAQLQALAYTQGNQVYVAPGHEKHLGHELGHVVQQKQSKTKSRISINGFNINDDPQLEREADSIALTGHIYEDTTHLNSNVAEGKVVQRIQAIRQTAANCGMFALAMALADLTDDAGDVLADSLDLYAIENGYSAIGEIFDAFALSRVGQEYCDTNYPDAGIIFVTLTFNTRDEMTAILNQSLHGQVYALLPYFVAAPNAMPGTPPPWLAQPDGQHPIALPAAMSRAHWSVIEQLNGGNHMIEGHNQVFGGPDFSLLTPAQNDLLFRSNMSLGDEFEWNPYLVGATNRAAQAPNSRDAQDMNNFNNSPRLGREIQTDQATGRITEQVQLRRHAVLVGTEAGIAVALENLQLIAPNVQ